MVCIFQRATYLFLIINIVHRQFILSILKVRNVMINVAMKDIVHHIVARKATVAKVIRRVPNARILVNSTTTSMFALDCFV